MLAYTQIGIIITVKIIKLNENPSTPKLNSAIWLGISQPKEYLCWKVGWAKSKVANTVVHKIKCWNELINAITRATSILDAATEHINPSGTTIHIIVRKTTYAESIKYIY